MTAFIFQPFLRSDKEKQKFQAEVYELLNQIETANKDKLVIQKTVEKLEHTVHESSIRIEELTRTVNEVTSTKSRLSQENAELIKEVHEYKVQLDNANHFKTQLASQLEDTKRRLEDEERVISEIKSVKLIIISNIGCFLITFLETIFPWKSLPHDWNRIGIY